LAVFSAFLEADDARRASDVVEKLLANGLRRCALTGSLALEARLRAHGRPVHRCALNDVDLVVDSFEAIPPALADEFLLNHVHPHAPPGKTLLQVIDREHAIRVDLFRAFGTTLSRARVLDDQTGPLPVLAIEDLVARTTAHVCGRLLKGLEIDPKYVHSLMRLIDLVRPAQLTDAWEDHRQDVPGTFEAVIREAHRLLVRHPERLVAEKSSCVMRACDRCQDYGPFRLAPREMIVDVLGYA
jgi:hypothetical protein